MTNEQDEKGTLCPECGDGYIDELDKKCPECGSLWVAGEDLTGSDDEKGSEDEAGRPPRSPSPLLAALFAMVGMPDLEELMTGNANPEGVKGVVNLTRSAEAFNEIISREVEDRLQKRVEEPESLVDLFTFEENLAIQGLRSRSSGFVDLVQILTEIDKSLVMLAGIAVEAIKGQETQDE